MKVKYATKCTKCFIALMHNAKRKRSCTRFIHLLVAVCSKNCYIRNFIAILYGGNLGAKQFYINVGVTSYVKNLLQMNGLSKTCKRDRKKARNILRGSALETVSSLERWILMLLDLRCSTKRYKKRYRTTEGCVVEN